MQLVLKNCAGGKGGLAGWAALLACLGVLAWAPALRAQIDYEETNVTVVTIGGGPPAGHLCGSPAGFVNGNTQEFSQFDGPVALALNSQATLFIADYTNNAVRMVTSVTSIGVNGNSTTVTPPYFTGLPGVVGVAVDAADNLYVLTQGDHTLRKYNYSFNLLFTNLLPYTPAALAVSLDAATNIFVAFTNGMVLEYAQSGAAIVGTNTIVASGSKLKPGGIAWRHDGVLAVSDLANNAIYLLTGVVNSVPLLYAGGGANGSTPGWVDGAFGFAEFNGPCGLAWSPDGQLVVADRLNNAVRRINASGTTSTIYGVKTNLWGPSDCSAGIFAGWVDGGFGPYQTNATGCAPAGVIIAPSSTIYVTELHYDLLREVTGVLFGSSTNGGTNGVGATNAVIPPPAFSPNSGYFPECQTIFVTSLVPSVYYTTDGTIPTTNSPLMVQMTNVTVVNNQLLYEGSLEWCNSLHDLSFLRLLAASGTNVSVVTNGAASPVNQIGFPAPRFAGSGSTAVIPLVVNLQSNTTLASLDFALQIIPTTSATPAIPAVTLLPISTNDFLQLVGPTPGNLPVSYQVVSFPPGSLPAALIPTNGLEMAVSALGNSGLSVQNFAVLALLEIPIPATAVEGQSYTLNVLNPSGTSDGAQANVPLTSMHPDPDHFQLPVFCGGFLAVQRVRGGGIWRRHPQQQRCQQCAPGLRRHPCSLHLHGRLQRDGCVSRDGHRNRRRLDHLSRLAAYFIALTRHRNQQLGPLLDQWWLSLARAHSLGARPDRHQWRIPKSCAGHHRQTRRGRATAGGGLAAAGFHPRRHPCPFGPWQHLFHPRLCQCPAGIQLVRPPIPRHAPAQWWRAHAGPDSI